MQPMLSDLELPQVQEIATYDRRILAQHEIPGFKGSLLQNMGRQPERILLWGVVIGDESLDFVEKLDKLFRDGESVSFIADIVTDTEIDQVLIEDLQWEELAGKPQRFAYALVLNEYIEPTEPETEVGLGGLESPVDTSILEDAAGLVDDVANALGNTEILDQLAGHLDRLTDLFNQL